MLKFYVMSILTYIIITYIIGQINFNQKKKTNFLVISNVIYNGILGYIGIRVIGVIFMHFQNIPTNTLGANTLPEINFMFNILVGVCASLMWLACLIPINKYVCDKSLIESNIYISVVVISMLAGIFISLLV